MPSELLQHEGRLSTWVLVDVLEAQSTVRPAPMRVTATLTWPAGTGFELRAYADTRPFNADGRPPPPDGGLLVDCDALASDEDDTQQVELIWGETDPDRRYANGVEARRRVAFEIRHVEGVAPMTLPGS